MIVVAPFYSGVAYRLGAFAKNHNVLERIIGSLSAEPEPEVFGAAEAGVESAVDGNEQPAHEGNNV